MTAYSSLASVHVLSSAPDGRRSRPAADIVRGYRIDVVACTVEDLVRSAGGWLYDRISAGWTVKVVMTEQGDIRPLQILGVPSVSTGAAGATKDFGYRLAVAADLLGSGAGLREYIVAALRPSSTEVILWGDVPDVLNRHVKAEQHRLSNAARMFKAQALRAASLPHERVGPTETLHGCARAILLEL